MTHHGDHGSDRQESDTQRQKRPKEGARDDGSMTVREAGERTAELIEKGKQAERREGGGSSGSRR